MAQVLSQDEVDALLQGIANDQVSTAEPSSPSEAVVIPRKPHAPSSSGDITPYDFARGEISFIGRLQGLQAIFSNFARRLQSMFASELGKSVDATFEDMLVNNIVDVVSPERRIENLR